MPVCEYIYCRAPFGDEVVACPRCGFPRDRARLQDPAFLAGAEVEGLPPAIIDLHQILPSIEGIEQIQLAVMERFTIEAALLQSVPPQATSLLGNAELLDLARRRPGRFWASQFADPRLPQAAELLERFVADGVKVVKLLPPAGFRPDDPAFDPFWETMERLGLVAMAHTGFITARHKREEARAGAFLSSRFADPLYWDQPARKFPRLIIILCHLGGALWYEQAAQMVTQHDNVWGDVSGFGLFALERLLRLGASPDWTKIFWGNDSPPFAYPMNLRLHRSALREAGAEELAPLLFHDNAKRFSASFLDASGSS